MLGLYSPKDKDNDLSHRCEKRFLRFIFATFFTFFILLNVFFYKKRA